MLPLILLGALIPCLGFSKTAFLQGEWALNPVGQPVTSVLHFYDDGMVDNVVSGITGKHQFLHDGRILIEFDDGVMIGDLEEAGPGYQLKGIFYPANQRIQLELTEPNQGKREEAKEFQDQLSKNLTQYQRANIDQAIRNNLAAIAAAAQMYMLLEGEIEVSLNELVGEGKLLPQLNSIYGESYDGLQINHETNRLSVRDKDGKEHAHEF